MFQPFYQSSIPLSAGQRALPGIIGGLGPLAHIEFEKRLLEQSLKRGASHDQDHPVWLLINAASTPDRTKSLQGLVDDATPWLLGYSQLLEKMGADFLIVTCNTAHAFHERVQPTLTIPWINMMRAVSRFIVDRYPYTHKIGVIATTGTLQAHLYQASLRRVALEPVVPTVGGNVQSQVMESIYAPTWGIKASGASVSSTAIETLSNVVDWFAKQGADMVIAGCTEISVGLACIEDLPLPWIDPLDIVADITVAIASGEVVLPATHSQTQSERIVFPPISSDIKSKV
ncbi:MAG: amino acid racemase [Cyanobacteria bacterium P01_D01_bin.1]